MGTPNCVYPTISCQKYYTHTYCTHEGRRVQVQFWAVGLFRDSIRHPNLRLSCRFLSWIVGNTGASFWKRRGIDKKHNISNSAAFSLFIINLCHRGATPGQFFLYDSTYIEFSCYWGWDDTTKFGSDLITILIWYWSLLVHQPFIIPCRHILIHLNTDLNITPLKLCDLIIILFCFY